MPKTWPMIVRLGIVLLLAAATARAAEPLVMAPAEPETPAETRPAASTDEQRVDAGQSIDLIDPVEPLVPLHRRTGRDLDRIKALALFAAGRVAEQQQKFPEGLRCYRRASASIPTRRRRSRRSFRWHSAWTVKPKPCATP